MARKMHYTGIVKAENSGFLKLTDRYPKLKVKQHMTGKPY